MRKLQILCDIDDVLNNLTVWWTLWLDANYHLDVKHEDITEWDMTKFYPSLTREQIYEPLKLEEFWSQLNPPWLAGKMIKQLLDDGHEIYLVSATHPYNTKFKYDYLQKFFSCIPSHNIIFTSQKQMIKGDVLIDDAPHHLIGGDYEKILVSAPYNRNFDTEGNGMYRADNWEEIYSIIQEIANK